MKRAVVFGAGSIGRGFIGASLSQAGWHVTFVDVAAPVISRLNADGYYNQVIVSNDGESAVRIEPVSGVLARDTAQVLRELHGAELVAVAVGANNLGPVAAVLGREAASRLGAGRVPLDVLLCENLHRAPDVMRDLIAAEAGAEVAATVGLAATSIGRMVPVPIPDPDDPLRVRVEPYSYLPYDAAALHSEPEVPDLVPITDGFTFYEDRKLYVHNMGHCLLAFLGQLRGYGFVWEAVEDVEIRYLVHQAMVEAATSLAVKHDQPIGALLDHVGDLIARFGNRALADTVERVARDPERKMQPDDRILGSFQSCVDNGVSPLFISVGVALGTGRLAELDGWDLSSAQDFVRRHLGREEAAGQWADLAWSLLPALEGAEPLTDVVALLDEFRRGVPAV